MLSCYLHALALAWIMAREREDPEDGEEREARAVEGVGPYEAKEAVA